MPSGFQLALVMLQKTSSIGRQVYNIRVLVGSVNLFKSHINGSVGRSYSLPLTECMLKTTLDIFSIFQVHLLDLNSLKLNSI